VRSTTAWWTPSVTATLAITVGAMLLGPSFVGILERSVLAPSSRAGSTPDEPPAAVVPAVDGTHAPSPGARPPVSPSATPDRPEAPPPPAAAPLLLRIGVLDVTAPVVPVGLLPGGGMEVPDDVSVVGWYAVDGRIIGPGDPGTAVLAGHRDSRRTGPGALHALARVVEGDTIGVLHADGTVSDWQVTEILTTPRDALPVAELFTDSGAARLAVVTCGGWFNVLTRSYSHNTIVIAHRIAEAPRTPAS